MSGGGVVGCLPACVAPAAPRCAGAHLLCSSSPRTKETMSMVLAVGARWKAVRTA